MILTKYNPMGEFRDLSTRFNSLLSEFDNKESQLGGFIPTVNTRENEFSYHVDADLPGVKKEDIKVDITDNVITISGERNDREEIKEEDYHHIETSFGKFERSFTLPKDADTENISAINKDGVLEVVIPKQKSETKKVKKIEVK